MKTDINIIVGLDTVLKTIDLEQMLYAIKRGKYKSQVENVRKVFQIKSKTDADKLKKNLLEAVTFSGTFKGKRKRDNIHIYNPLYVLDYDNIPFEELGRFKAIACECQYTFSAFISPKGNGLKIIVRTDSTLEDFHNNYSDVVAYYDMILGIDADYNGGYGVERICFVSYDPDLHYNPNSKIFSNI